MRFGTVGLRRAVWCVLLRLPGTVSDMIDLSTDSLFAAAEPAQDLRAFFRSVGQFRKGTGLKASPAPRKDSSSNVELLVADPAEVTADPVDLVGFCDGIQAAKCVVHRSRRPVYLVYAAAAVVGSAGQPVAVRERLRVLASDTDTAWAERLDGGVVVCSIGSGDPAELELAAHKFLGGFRADMERLLVQDVAAAGFGDRFLVLDGSIVNRVDHPRLVGVVKTARTKYLPDEAQLFTLPVGWRSATFRIGGPGGWAERFSTYVRLWDSDDARWDYGLVRLEARDADVLDGLAARCLIERQTPGVRDARWDRHLSGVRSCEDFLRSRRPPVFV